MKQALPSVLAPMALALVGCARPAEKVAEKTIVSLLPGYVGPADSYKVKVKSDSLGAMLRGRARTVHIDGRGVRLTPELTLETLTLDAEEVEVDRRAGTLRSVGEASFNARIGEASLDAMVRKRRPKLLALGVSLVGPYVRVKVTPEVFGYPTVPITVDGELLARDGGGALDFEPASARLSILPIPKPILDFVAERLNPIVDLRGLSLPIQVERAQVRGGTLVLDGQVPSEELIRRSQQKR